MKLPIGLVLAAIGVVLLVIGINASESFASDVSRFFTGEPTDRAIWYMVGGIAALVAGMAIAFVPEGTLKRA
jgi:multisubunit Na+/H+ antiporter MnhB subunit